MRTHQKDDASPKQNFPGNKRSSAVLRRYILSIGFRLSLRIHSAKMAG